MHLTKDICPYYLKQMKKIVLLSIIVISFLLSSCENDIIYPVINDFYSSTGDSLILFISRRTENSPLWHLYKMNLDGTQQTRITDISVKYAKPVVSHSGKQVLFVHSGGLSVINIDGTNLTLIDNATRSIGSPDWSPDDSKIIYSKNRNQSTDERDIILHDFETNNKLTLTNTYDNVLARFSKDAKIAVWRIDDNSYDIFVMNSDGSNKQEILTDAKYPVWSPGGQRIAYVSYVHYNGTGFFGSPQIFIANIDGSHSIQLTNEYLSCWDSGYPDFGNSEPHWTPDGKSIVYESEINDGESEIYIMDSDGRNKRRLTNTDGHNESPVVSSDGKFIVFSSSRDLIYSSDIYVIDIYGNNQMPISKYSGNDCCPVISGK